MLHPCCDINKFKTRYLEHAGQIGAGLEASGAYRRQFDNVFRKSETDQLNVNIVNLEIAILLNEEHELLKQNQLLF